MTEKTWFETIACPECGRVQQGAVTHYEGFHWPIYAHTCTGCGYEITESEWEEYHPAPDNLVAVHWRNEATGETGKGERVAAQDAQAWVDFMNDKWRGHIHHWTEASE